jgi:hypothetical protein
MPPTEMHKPFDPKREFIIETWERLDCESVGAAELLEIERALIAKFGPKEEFLPMRVARLLADEGAELRHPEIMDLFISRFPKSAEAADYSGLFRFTSLAEALESIRGIENLRRQFVAKDDKAAIGQLRSRLFAIREDLKQRAGTSSKEPQNAEIFGEIASWLGVWLETPEMFENWLTLRRRSPDFSRKFPNLL